MPPDSGHYDDSVEYDGDVDEPRADAQQEKRNFRNLALFLVQRRLPTDTR